MFKLRLHRNKFVIFFLFFICLFILNCSGNDSKSSDFYETFDPESYFNTTKKYIYNRYIDNILVGTNEYTFVKTDTTDANDNVTFKYEYDKKDTSGDIISKNILFKFDSLNHFSYHDSTYNKVIYGTSNDGFTILSSIFFYFDPFFEIPNPPVQNTIYLGYSDKVVSIIASDNETYETGMIEDENNKQYYFGNTIFLIKIVSGNEILLLKDIQ